MAKKAKGNRVQVILECTEQKGSGVPGMSRYITTKNRKNTTERLFRKVKAALSAKLSRWNVRPKQVLTFSKRKWCPTTLLKKRSNKHFLQSHTGEVDKP